MGKYQPLESFLLGNKAGHIPMRFSEIEAIIGFSLPASKKYPAWWSNSPTNNPMTKAWLGAGYQTEQVDTAAERLVFRRVQAPRADPRQARPSGGPFPGYGAMKGTVRVSFEVDLSAPADPQWGDAFK